MYKIKNIYEVNVVQRFYRHDEEKSLMDVSAKQMTTYFFFFVFFFYIFFFCFFFYVFFFFYIFFCFFFYVFFFFYVLFFFSVFFFFFLVWPVLWPPSQIWHVLCFLNGTLWAITRLIIRFLQFLANISSIHRRESFCSDKTSYSSHLSVQRKR